MESSLKKITFYLSTALAVLIFSITGMMMLTPLIDDETHNEVVSAPWHFPVIILVVVRLPA